MKLFKILISFILIISLLGCSTTRGSGPQPKYSYTHQQHKYKQGYYPQKSHAQTQYHPQATMLSKKSTPAISDKTLTGIVSALGVIGAIAVSKGNPSTVGGEILTGIVQVIGAISGLVLYVVVTH